MRPWFVNHLSHTPSTETNALNAISILTRSTSPGLTIFAEADPAYDHEPKRRLKFKHGAKSIVAFSRPRKHTKLRKNTKLTGELGEAAFLHAAIHRGLCIARPWGDSRRYDFIIQSSPTSNTFHRIQVKCTESPNASGFQEFEMRAPGNDFRSFGEIFLFDVAFAARAIDEDCVQNREF